MGERKRRLASFGSRAEAVRQYERTYLSTLRDLLLCVPSEHLRPPVTVLACVGKAQIWPCTDAAVVLVYPDPQLRVETIVKSPLATTAEEFMEKNPACDLLDSQGNRSSLRAVLTTENVRAHIAGHMLDIRIQDGGRTYRPRFMRLSVVGWDSALPDPVHQARKDFSAALLAVNTLGSRASTVTTAQVRGAAIQKAKEMLDRYAQVLSSPESEEQLQRFLLDNPTLLYPDYVQCHPKFRLGDDYVTDFVFDVQGPSGRQHVFVEIENPSKRIFTAQGHFTSDYSQAKGQLLDWERWITKNHGYLTQKLPGVFMPAFHLVIGRSDRLTSVDREKLRAEYDGTTHLISTYDDLLERYRQILSHLK